MRTVEVHVEPRTGRGKGTARKLRRSGVIPAVLYGPKRQATETIALRREEFTRKLSHLEGSHLIRLLAEGAGNGDLNDRMVLVREIQRHPVTGDVLHADFYEVDLTERLTVSVPLHFIGKAAGVVAGGILQPVMREVEVECLPTEIPEFIDVDVSALGIHEAVHVSELQLPEGVSPVGDQSQPVVTVLPPTVEEAKPVAEAAEAPAGEVAPAEGGAAAPAPETAAGGKRSGGEG
jgi:large subunit ribosomal protein L25